MYNIHRFKSHFICLACLLLTFSLQAQTDVQRQRRDKPQRERPEGANRPEIFADESRLTGNIVLGSPTNNSIIISVIVANGTELYAEYGTRPEELSQKTKTTKADKTGPVEIRLDKLKPNTCYYYRLCYRTNSKQTTSSTNHFYTQRKPGSSFSFGIQGDSHPERQGKMFHPDLYRICMQNAVQARPDFYFMMGDDFSIDHIIQKNEATQSRVEGMYLNQRYYLEPLSKNAPVFLVNGNHEQAAKYLLDGTANNPAVLAANARNKFFPLPIPNAFYSGDTGKVEHIGLLGDYYAFEWGDALFVVIDPYWYSDKAVDNIAGSREKNQRNLWDITLGKTQYDWFKSTLEKSNAKFKFVFCHHVLGTGRGGVENARFYEWGGCNRQGIYEFDKMRPGWTKPIHQLMADNKVTIFFQGHDHLYCKQELDGVVYQTLPCPADNSYSTFNADAYKGIKFSNSGFLQVTVNAREVKVDYLSSVLKADETDRKNNEIVHSYSIRK